MTMDIIANPHTAAEMIRDGKIVAFPTETVYGLGADALNEKSVNRVFKIKGRPAVNPIICHLPSSEEVFRYGEYSSLAERLSKFWPGPLTILLPHKGRIPSIVTAGSDLAGFRVPSHPMALEMLREAKTPVAAPSANLSNTRSPTTAEMVKRQLGDLIDGILDGGPCRIGVESTVVKLEGEHVRILREGGVSAEKLEEEGIPVIHAELKTSSSQDKPSNQTGLLSPGNLPLHYAPSVPLVYLDNIFIDKPDSVICLNSNPYIIKGEDISGRSTSIRIVFINTVPETISSEITENVINLFGPHGIYDVAHRLYRTLDELSSDQYDLVVAVPPALNDIGRAIQDRLYRASSYRGFIKNNKLILKKR